MLIVIIEILIIFLLKFTKKRNKIKIKKKFYNDRGKYKSILSNCISCHTVQGGKPFSGGYSIKTIFGIINTPNITPDGKYGIGKLTLKNFINLLKEGINSKGEFLFPAFPFLNYSKIKKKDIKDIFLFLKKIKKENLINKKNLIKSPIKYKNILLGWRILFFKKNFFKKNKKKSNFFRGNYIIKSFGHCNMCHTKMNNVGRLNKYFKYKGKNLIENWKVTETISNGNKGIKKKKIKELYNLLKYGISKEKTINGAMCEVVNNSLQYINKIDLISIVRVMKNIINKNKIINININKKKNIKKKYKLGKKNYKKKCISCHGKINLGNYPIYPKIIERNKDKNGIENLKNVIKSNNIVTTIKYKYVSFMPLYLKLKNKFINVFLQINQKLRII